MPNKYWVLAFALLSFLGSCVSPSTPPVTLAPSDVPVWSTPQDVPSEVFASLQDKYFQYVAESDELRLYRNLFVKFPDGIASLPVSLPAGVVNVRSRFSRDGRYYAYITFAGPPEIGIVDLQEQSRRTLFRLTDRAFGGFISVAFGPSNRYLRATIEGQKYVEMLHIELPEGTIRRFVPQAPLAPWTTLDIAPDGVMVAQCFDVSPQGQVVTYLCLLDPQGVPIQDLTPRIIFREHYQYAAMFTPDGQCVIYDLDFRLYKVCRGGDAPIQISACTVNGPVWVTNMYVLTPCYTQIEPKCYALYAAALNSSGLYRIEFIPEICPALQITQESKPNR